MPAPSLGQTPLHAVAVLNADSLDPGQWIVTDVSGPRTLAQAMALYGDGWGTCGWRAMMPRARSRVAPEPGILLSVLGALPGTRELVPEDRRVPPELAARTLVDLSAHLRPDGRTVPSRPEPDRIATRSVPARHAPRPDDAFALVSAVNDFCRETDDRMRARGFAGLETREGSFDRSLNGAKALLKHLSAAGIPGGIVRFEGAVDARHPDRRWAALQESGGRIVHYAVRSGDAVAAVAHRQIEVGARHPYVGSVREFRGDWEDMAPYDPGTPRDGGEFDEAARLRSGGPRP